MHPDACKATHGAGQWQCALCAYRSRAVPSRGQGSAAARVPSQTDAATALAQHTCILALDLLALAAATRVVPSFVPAGTWKECAECEHVRPVVKKHQRSGSNRVSKEAVKAEIRTDT